MNSYWPAIIAVIGTLSGTALTAIIGWVDKERSFRREWLRHQFDKRTDVYNDILRQAQMAIFAIREARFASMQPGHKADPKLLEALHRTIDGLRDSMAAQTLYCSQAVRDAFNRAAHDPIALDKQRPAAANFFVAIEERLTDALNEIERLAAEETSLRAFKKKLRA